MHYDLVKNEWLAGMQVRLVTTTLTENGPQLINVTPGWEDLLDRPLTDEYGTVVYVGKEPEVLTRCFRSEYVFSTDAHDEANCPFRGGPVVPMSSVPPLGHNP